MRQVHHSRRENYFITLLFLIMERSTDQQITHVPDGLLLQPWRQENYPSQSEMSSGGLVSFFVVKGMCASESWGTKKLVSVLQRRSYWQKAERCVLSDFPQKCMSTLQLYVFYQHWNKSASNESAPLRLTAYTAGAHLVCRLKHSPVSLFLWNNKFLVQQVWL